MCALNIHTLHDDILYELLITCRDLISLKRLILTHSAIYHAFNNRRRLVLRAVFKTQSIVRLRYCTNNEHYLKEAHRYIVYMPPCNVIDRVALREALWPIVRQSMPSMISCEWALALHTRYSQAGLKHNELVFAKEAALTMLSTSLPLHFEQRTLFRAITQTYAASDTPEEAIELDEAIIQRLDPRLDAHKIWVEDFMHTYQTNRNGQKGLDLQLRCWQLCRDTRTRKQSYSKLRKKPYL